MADQLPNESDPGARRGDAADLGGRWLVPAAPWLVLGTVTAAAGGLLAAVVAHDPTQKPVWASAYLVLVAGLGQVALALGRTLLAPRPAGPGVVARDFVVFALGNAAVVIGTLSDVLRLVDIGGILLVVALGLMVWGVRPQSGAPTQRQPWMVGLLWLYRVLVIVLLVSIPIGLLLARR